MVTPRVAGGMGLTAQWSDDFHHALHSTLTGEGQGYYADFAAAGLGGVAKVLTGAFFHDGMWSSFRRRHHGRPVEPRACRAGSSSATCRTTTRSATGPSATGSPRPSPPASSPSARRSS